MWLVSFPLVAIATLVLAILTAFKASQTARTPQGAVGWVVFIATLPFLAIPAYLIFGYARTGKFQQRRARVRAALNHPLAEASPPASQEGRSRLQTFTAMGGGAPTCGNGVKILKDGPATYDAIIESIGEAQTYVLVEYYTIRSDEVGHRFRQALFDAVGRGVRVRVLYDPMGCFLTRRSFLKSFSRAGIDMQASRGPARPLGRIGLNFRNHRKTVVVDGTTGFTGGINVGDEFVGRWRDTHMKLHGPIVAQLQRIFAEDWEKQRGDAIDKELNWEPGRSEQDLDALVMATGPLDDVESATLYFCALAQAAERRLWITTPYFVPSADVLTALKVASLRGVDVRVVVPHDADKWLPWIAAFAFFDDVRAVGIRIYRYHEAFMHQKVVLVDDDLVSIGTINMDIRSCLLNFETTVIFQSESLAREVEEMLCEDLERSHLMRKTRAEWPLWLRISGPLVKLLAPIL
jgi:cardiolipin synthase